MPAASILLSYEETFSIGTWRLTITLIIAILPSDAEELPGLKVEVRAVGMFLDVCRNQSSNCSHFTDTIADPEALAI